MTPVCARSSSTGCSCSPASRSGRGIGLQLQNSAGLKNLRLVNHMNAMGATPASMVQYATMAIQNGMASSVVCVFADAPMTDPAARSSAGMNAARGNPGRSRPASTSLEMHYGPLNPNAGYAMAARRHMALYGTTSEQLGAIAVSTRAWAANNPIAQIRTPITIEDHQNSRWIAEPFHLLDCCLISNGAVAVIVTSAERARDMKSKPAYVLAMAQGYPGNLRRAGERHDWMTGAAIAARHAVRADRHHGPATSNLRAVRLLHLHDAGDAGGLRLLRARAKAARSSRTASWAPVAACRPTPAAASLARSTCGA